MTAVVVAGLLLTASACAPSEATKGLGVDRPDASAAPWARHSAFSRIDLACVLDDRGAIHCALGRPGQVRRVVVSSEKPFSWIDGDTTELLALAACGRVARVLLPEATIEWLPRSFRATQIAFGVRSCALSDEGEVFCWDGYTAGTTTPREELDRAPRRVPLPQPVVELRSHNDRICARDEVGDVYCWGGIGEDWTDAPMRIFSSAHAVAVTEDDLCAVVGDRRELTCFGPARDRPIFDAPLEADHHVQSSNLAGVDALFGAAGVCAVAAGWLWCDRLMREDPTLAETSPGSPATPEGGPIRLTPVMPARATTFWATGTALCWTRAQRRQCTTRLTPPWPTFEEEPAAAPSRVH